FLVTKTLQPPLLSVSQPRWAPPRLEVLLFVLVLEVAAAGLMIIGEHKLLRNIDRFLHDHRPLLCILDLVLTILNLHNINSWSFLRIYLIGSGSSFFSLMRYYWRTGRTWAGLC